MPVRPNILFIISDQMVAALNGAYGHPVVQTPHLSRLAAEGVRFDSAYTPFPLCSPGRACLMTGRHASAIGAYDNATLLPADQPTFAHYLSNAGYDTVLSGKMHFVGPDQLHGFQRRLTTDIYPASFDWVRRLDSHQRNPWRGLRSDHGRPPRLPRPGLHRLSSQSRSLAQRAQLRRRNALPRRRISARAKRVRRALFSLRLLPPPARALPPTAKILGSLRGRRYRHSRFSRRSRRQLLGDGPLAQRLSRHPQNRSARPR